MSHSIDMRGLERLEKDLNALLKEIPEARRKLHQQFADLAKGLVDESIDATVNDANGHVKSWQEKRVGSGGGYAAVSPQKGKTGRDSPGAITNYLENGHAIRSSSARVEGRHFYAAAATKAQAKALELAEGFAEKLAAQLEGK